MFCKQLSVCCAGSHSPMHVQSRLEGKTVKLDDLRAFVNRPTANGNHDSSPDSHATDDSEFGPAEYYQKQWWAAASHRFSQEQVSFTSCLQHTSQQHFNH